MLGHQMSMLFKRNVATTGLHAIQHERYAPFQARSYDCECIEHISPSIEILQILPIRTLHDLPFYPRPPDGSRCAVQHFLRRVVGQIVRRLVIAYRSAFRYAERLLGTLAKRIARHPGMPLVNTGGGGKVGTVPPVVRVVSVDVVVTVHLLALVMMATFALLPVDVAVHGKMVVV